MATELNTLVTASSDNVTNLIGYQQQNIYNLTLIKRMLPYLPLYEDFQMKHIADHQGGFGTNVIKFRKFVSLQAAASTTDLTYANVSTTALTEGTNPEGLSVTTSEVTAQLAQYGQWLKLTDIAATAGIDDVVKENMSLLAENAGQTIHKVMMNTLISGATTNVTYAGSATGINDLTNSDVMTSTVIKKAVRTLRAANVPTFPDGYYRGLISPYQAYDLMSDSLWQDVAKYGGGLAASGGIDLLKGEIGRMHGVRFRETNTVLPVANTGPYNTYTAFIYGPDGLGAFDLKSQAVGSVDTRTNLGVSVHYVPVNMPTKDDPLGLYGILGWKTAFCAVVLDPIRINKVITGATQ